MHNLRYTRGEGGKTEALRGLEMRMSEWWERGVFRWGYFEKQLCISVSKGMNTVSEEEHTPVSHVLLLLFRSEVLVPFRLSCLDNKGCTWFMCMVFSKRKAYHFCKLWHHLVRWILAMLWLHVLYSLLYGGMTNLLKSFVASTDGTVLCVKTFSTIVANKTLSKEMKPLIIEKQIITHRLLLIFLELIFSKLQVKLSTNHVFWCETIKSISQSKKTTTKNDLVPASQLWVFAAFLYLLW